VFETLPGIVDYILLSLERGGPELGKVKGSEKGLERLQRARHEGRTRFARHYHVIRAQKWKDRAGEVVEGESKTIL